MLTFRWPTLALLAIGLTVAGAAQTTRPAEPKWTSATPVNALPNPYRRDANWARLPAGMKWGAVIGAEPGPDGHIYVVHRCFENSCAGRSEPPIFKFDPAGNVVKSWGAGVYVFPHGFHVDAQGNLWVSDAQGRDGKGHQVFKYDPNGALLMTIGTAGVSGDGAAGKLHEPTDVVTAPNGDIFITEGHAVGGAVNRVSKWSKDGAFIKAWGKTGSGPGEFNAPHTIAVDSRGRLFVGDRSNNRIQIFDLDGRFLEEWTQFGRPSGIAITADDTIYVADSESWGPDEPGWKKGIRIGSARDGSVKYFIEDVESTTEEHSGAEGVGVDREGNVYGSVVRRMMLEKHILRRPDSTAPLRFAISFPPSRSAQPLDGRVLLFVSDDGRTEPRMQTDQYRANTTRPIFGVDVDGLKPSQDVVIDDKIVGWPARSLKDIPPGDYWVQALLARYETFHRADGHVVKMPMDQGEGQRWAAKPGNFYSKPVKMHLDPAATGEVRISVDQEIPPIPLPTDTKLVKYISVQNERLTKFWGRPMYLGAIVLLPAGWDTHPNAHYPLLVHHGHFPSSMASDGWRETPPDPNAEAASRTQQQAAYQFYKDWNGPNFPRMIHLLVQHPTPYFDDSYAVNSANNGPYGDAITLDLIPQIEKQFRGIGQGWARVTTGGSTGGWEAFGVQVKYPDAYNGAWALCPDPVDFRSYRSVNIYDEHNAYFYEDNPWKRTPKPGYRDYRDHLYSTFEDRNLVELAIGTHGRSGGQHDAWASVFGPVGSDGYYKPLYDKMTGAIDPEVARYWRDNYDLRYILQRDWATLGPKLRGKIHITSGTMDNGYLNNAVYQMEEFLMRATPSAESEIIYGERREHCFTGDTEHPNAVGSRTVHQRYMPAMMRWMIRTAPPGADTKSWVY